MEGSSRNKESCPQLLDLIHKQREWLVNGDEQRFAVAEEKKLELRLGPPGEDWFTRENHKTNHFSSTAAAAASKTWLTNQDVNHPHISFLSSPYLHNFPQTHPVKAKESTITCGEFQDHSTEKKACSQPSPASSVPANTAVNNSSQKRSAPPVVGWPPVRSFRKNLASSSSSKPSPDSQKGNPPKEVITPHKENSSKGLFVKINMDGVPIGRKVDLKACNSYDKLSFAVDELFRGLLAAQNDSPAVGNPNKIEDAKAIRGLLDGSGEYTLVYEDNEGDRMLVGDVPWEMFASSVRRLRVLKSSELSSFRLGSGKQEKTPLEM